VDSPDLGKNASSARSATERGELAPRDLPEVPEAIGKVVTLPEMINWCIRNRSGQPLEVDSPEMTALVAYARMSGAGEAGARQALRPWPEEGVSRKRLLSAFSKLEPFSFAALRSKVTVWPQPATRLMRPTRQSANSARPSRKSSTAAATSIGESNSSCSASRFPMRASATMLRSYPYTLSSTHTVSIRVTSDT